MNKLKGIYMNKLFGLLVLLSLSGFSSVAYGIFGMGWNDSPYRGNPYACPTGQTYNFQIKEGGGYIGCETSTPSSTPPTPTPTCKPGWYAKGDDCCETSWDIKNRTYIAALSTETSEHTLSGNSTAPARVTSQLTCSSGYEKRCEIEYPSGWYESFEGEFFHGFLNSLIEHRIAFTEPRWNCVCRKSIETCEDPETDDSGICEADERQEGSLCCKTETTRQYAPRSTRAKKCPAGQEKRGSSCYGLSETRSGVTSCPTGSNWYAECINLPDNPPPSIPTSTPPNPNPTPNARLRNTNQGVLEPYSSCTCKRYDEFKGSATYRCPAGQTKSGNQCCSSQSYAVSSSSSSNSACTRGGTLGCTAARTRTFWVPNNNPSVNSGPDTQYECEHDTWVNSGGCVRKTVTTPKSCSCTTQTSCSTLSSSTCPSGYTDDGTQCYKDTPGVCRDPSCPVFGQTQNSAGLCRCPSGYSAISPRDANGRIIPGAPKTCVSWCKPDYEKINNEGSCVPKCDSGEVRNASGTCVSALGCRLPRKDYGNGKCCKPATKVPGSGLHLTGQNSILTAGTLGTITIAGGVFYSSAPTVGSSDTICSSRGQGNIWCQAIRNGNQTAWDCGCDAKYNLGQCLECRDGWHYDETQKKCIPSSVQCPNDPIHTLTESGICCPNGKGMPVGGRCCPDGKAITSSGSCGDVSVGNPPSVDLAFPRTFNVHGDLSVRSHYSIGRTDRPDYECYAYKINDQNEEVRQRQPSAYCFSQDTCTRDGKNRCVCKTLKNNKFVDITSSNNGASIGEDDRFDGNATYCEYAGLDPLRIEGSDDEYTVDGSNKVMSREFKNVTTVTIPFVPPH